MKSTTLILGSLLASAAIAQPHRQHNAKHHHNKRVELVVWQTETVIDYETVGVTTTIWVSDGFVAPTVTSPSTPSIPSAAAAASSSQIPAQFFEGGGQSPTESSSSSVYVAPAPVSTYVPPVTTSEAPAYVAPAPSSSSSSVYVAPAYAPPAGSTTAAAPAAVSSSSSSAGSSTDVCSSSSPCEGDITWYTAGLGACGSTSDGTVDKVVALPYALMGSLSNTNPYCGKTITIQCTATGKTTTATVVDKCMGCKGYAIDLSNAAFDELDNELVGRTNGTWWFN
jgi:hypothetical protein